MARFLTLVVFIGLMYAVEFLSVSGTQPGSATFTLGSLLLASFLAGRAARAISLPQITGYLIIGIIVGPFVLGIIEAEMIEQFRIVDHVALALIALSAGGELRLNSLRDRFRSIGVITLFQIILMFSFVAVVVFLARGSIEFLGDQPTRVAVAVALLFGLVAVANSPATTIAIITEEKARGILTDTVLGITVLKDVVILILIAVLIPLAVTITDPGQGFDFHRVWEILREIVGSLAMGVAIGWLMTLYLSRIRTYRILFVLGVAFLSVVLEDVLDLHNILIAMAAGFYVQNYSRQGRRLLHALEANSLPVYALFFAVAGASLNVGILRTAWVVATVLFLARLVSLWGSTYLGAKLVGDPPVLRRLSWVGFAAQAGVTLGIANKVGEEFPAWGPDVATLIIALIAVNQIVGPPAFRWAIVKAGESYAPNSAKKPRR
jgi:Kef-type K+ transport system membrane component KefB